MKAILKLGAIALAAMSVNGTAFAAQIFSTGYDTPNGDGSGGGAGGTFNYWDKNYSGSGATTTDGAPLTGGSGDLTDGLIAGDIWANVESLSGEGPYVGWRGGFSNNPLLTFYFAGSPTINSINFHIDNSGLGGVFAPTDILIDGVSQAFTGPALGNIGWASITGLNLSGNSHTVQFNQLAGNAWVFASEVTFSGAVPEPASWAMMIMGFGLVGGALRSSTGRRRANVRPALG